MARVVALVPDLLFGSRVHGALSAAGDDVELIGDAPRLRERLGDPDAAVADVLIVDLTDERLDGASVLEALAGDGLVEEVRTLAFYSHVDAAVRERATEAGFDLVVPRSRMAREAGELVAGLAARG